MQKSLLAVLQGQESRWPQAPCRGRHARFVDASACASGRLAGSRWGPPGAAQPWQDLSTPAAFVGRRGLCRRVRAVACPRRSRPPDQTSDRQTQRRPQRLSSAAAALGGGTLVGVEQPVSALEQGLRGTAQDHRILDLPILYRLAPTPPDLESFLDRTLLDMHSPTVVNPPRSEDDIGAAGSL